ncbi:MAG: Eco57I restriction-modification methylase domain-containing protein [Kiritimatiellae bacterium]|nr:Eco57I restriction-modification methylase domain-containing protein [Kiritimatiellia bacterium]
MSALPDTKPLDEIIVGRVEPRIYAFLTTSVPRYLKVGDTYRPVPVRIAEWQKHFTIDETRDVWDWPAVLDDEVFFRDYSVHQYLQDGKSLIRLDKAALAAIAGGKDLYFSNEFFLDARREHVEEALADIRDDHAHSTGKYSFYSVRDIGRDPDDEPEPTPVDLHLRPNQAEAVERFKAAVAAGRTNLLMYAVMRFGKTVTSLQCARELNARFVVVVSGKADVAREWRNTVLGFTDFRNDYVFLSRRDLDAKYTRVTEELDAGHKVVLFATLQDLQGDAIKPRHEQVFANPIDLLVIDETHFAARADQYGRPLRTIPKESRDVKEGEDVSAADAAKAVKALAAKVRLHLSGTPYRILMGSEFQKEDIVSFCQFTDILDEQRKWNAENLGRDEWDNPYYGFPQMVRFAFNLNESARKRLEELEAAGKTSHFRELFRPMSMEKDASPRRLHRKFVHEQEVVDLLRAIGGAVDEPGILPFLKYEKIEKGQMCHHIVCVLPYCASCDALEALLDPRNRKYRGTFGKLGEYKVINISGTEVKKGFVKIADVVKTISDCERKGEKTLTLTVNRMLTGSTVPEWDTMLFLKDTSSPQEYDQAVFRLQSSFIRIMDDGKGRTVKFNMKPQTLLVDFDPARMFRLQEARAQAYNVNTDTNGNRELENRVARELAVSPIVLFNKDRIHRVEASDVMAAISQYSSTRGVAEEVEEIPVDRSVQNDPTLRKFIDGLPEHGSKEGLTLKPHTGEETDADTGDAETGDGEGEGDGNAGEAADSASGDSEEQKKRDQRIKTLHSLIVFYSFLVPERVHSLDEILAVIDKSENNKRIARHLELEKDLLERYRNKVGWQTLQMLDYKIQNLDRLANETQDIDLGDEYKDTPKAVKKAIVAMRKFGRLGEAKIVTPPNIAYDMVRQIPGAELKTLVESGRKILDLAAKMGEFAIAIVRRCAEPDIGLSSADLAQSILSIPMCGVTYEFTRKVYELLGLDVTCIAQPENMTTYDLLKVKAADGKTPDYARIKRILTQNKDFNTISIGDEVAEGEQTMCKTIGLVISNPPYQEPKEATSDPSIYNLFIDLAHTVAPISTLITPARYLFDAGKTPHEFNERMLNDDHIHIPIYDPDARNIFPEAGFKGGVSVIYRDLTKTFGKIISFSSYKELNSILHKVAGSKGFTSITKNLYLQNKFNLDALYIDYPELKSIIGSHGRERRLTTSIFSIGELFKSSNSEGLVEILGLIENNRTSRYIAEKYLASHPNLKKYKVIIPKANGTGALGEVFSSPLIGSPMLGYTQSFISIGAFDSKAEARAALKYIKTKFLRTMLGLLKVTQDNNTEVWRFVPLQDFTESSDIDWSKPIPDIDRQLYAKYGLTEAEQKFIESMIKPME